MKGKARGVLFAVLSIAVSYGLYKLSGLVFDKMENTFLGGMLKEIVFAAAALIAVVLLHRKELFRSDVRLLKKGWSAIGLLFVPMLMSLQSALVIGGFTIGAVDFIFFLIHMFLIGFCEEVLFRGLLMNSFLDLFGEKSTWSILAAVICTSLLFGGMHLGNGLNAEVGMQAASVQAVMTFGYGMIFGSAYYRTGKCLWYVIAIHAINDAIGFAASGRLSGGSAAASIASTGGGQAMGAEQYLIIMGVFILVSIFLLRNKKLQQMREIQGIEE